MSIERPGSPGRLGLDAMAIVGAVIVVSAMAYGILEARPGGSDILPAVAFAIAFCAMLASLVRCLRRAETPATLAFILVVAGITRILCVVLGDPQTFSGDVYRHVFEGHVVAAGDNPYRFAPSSPNWDALTAERGISDIRANVNQADMPAIYPPLAQALFALNVTLGGSVMSWRAAVAVCDGALLAILLALLRLGGRRPEWLLLWAWNPIVLLEGATSGHLDLPAITMAMGALLAFLRGRWAWCWTLLSASVLIKVLAVILVPLLLSKASFRSAWIFVAFCGGAFLFLMQDPPDAEGTPYAGGFTPDAVVWAEPPRASHVTDAPAAEPIVKATTCGGRSAIALDAGGSLVVVSRDADAAIGSSAAWDLVIGRYQVFATHDGPADLDGRRIVFDGTGRIVGEWSGRYWRRDDGTFVIAREDGQTAATFRPSRDRQLLVPGAGESGIVGVKRSEPPFFASRQFGARWASNAPHIQAVIDSLTVLLDEPDEHRGRRIFQIGALVMLAATILLLRVSGVATVRAAFVSLSFLVLSSPTIHPWYSLWVVVFTPLVLAPAATTWSFTVLLAYLGLELLEYGIPVVVGVACFAWSRRARRAGASRSETATGRGS